MSDVEFLVHSGVGRITLNRPRALNALTHDMVRAVTEHLLAWRVDPVVRAVVVDGAGDRGLCAGGDIRSIHDDARSGGTASLEFWADEYRMNALIGRYPKPFLAVMDGIVMGGGVGIAAHGTHRVVTDRSSVAMPETGIGFVPDVGGTYLLAHAPGQAGTHVALTAGRLSASDAIHCGLADHYVPARRLPDLFDALASRTPDAALELVAEPAPPSRLAAARAWIDHCYAPDTVEEILDRLRGGGEEAVSAAKEIEGKSPTALKVTLRALRSAAAMTDLGDALAQEYRISHRAFRSAEFAEGVRAQIIDKDRSPRWSPATLAEVDDELVASYFADLGEAELKGVWAR
ncbi:enoyl-CoA hydratase/isomerase family protein [Amycolatopsis sp. NPDC047767]|uniref:enoyl-CoA hydratase/isomerase family protein n=1 Tax=Amycolatopsis sp. NPDC047767 TaxID=3156765 RepID=UPI003452F8C7